MNNQKFTINSEYTLKCYIEFITKLWREKKWIEATFTTDKKRSGAQNNALHLYCSQLSNQFNAAGLDMVQVLKHHAEIPWDAKGFNVKERIWRPVQEGYCQENSTAKVSTADYPQIYDIVNRYTASKLGISVDWPSKESM